MVLIYDGKHVLTCEFTKLHPTDYVESNEKQNITKKVGQCLETPTENTSIPSISNDKLSPSARAQQRPIGIMSLRSLYIKFDIIKCTVFRPTANSTADRLRQIQHYRNQRKRDPPERY